MGRVLTKGARLSLYNLAECGSLPLRHTVCIVCLQSGEGRENAAWNAALLGMRRTGESGRASNTPHSGHFLSGRNRDGSLGRRAAARAGFRPTSPLRMGRAAEFHSIGLNGPPLRYRVGSVVT